MAGFKVVVMEVVQWGSSFAKHRKLASVIERLGGHIIESAHQDRTIGFLVYRQRVEFPVVKAIYARRELRKLKCEITVIHTTQATDAGWLYFQRRKLDRARAAYLKPRYLTVEEEIANSQPAESEDDPAS